MWLEITFGHIFDRRRIQSYLYYHQRIFKHGAFFFFLHNLSCWCFQLKAPCCQCQPAVTRLPILSFFRLLIILMSFFSKLFFHFPCLSKHLSFIVCLWPLPSPSLSAFPVPSLLWCSCHSEDCRHFSSQDLPCTTFLHSDANSAGQLSLSMQLYLCCKSTLLLGTFESARVALPLELPVADKLGPQAHKPKINNDIQYT